MTGETFKCFPCQHQHQHNHSHITKSAANLTTHSSPDTHRTPRLEAILTVLHLWLELVRVGSREITRRGYNDDAGAQLSFPVLLLLIARPNSWLISPHNMSTRALLPSDNSHLGCLQSHSIRPHVAKRAKNYEAIDFTQTSLNAALRLPSWTLILFGLHFWR